MPGFISSRSKQTTLFPDTAATQHLHVTAGLGQTWSGHPHLAWRQAKATHGHATAPASVPSGTVYVCRSLRLHSNYAGGSKDYLSWSVLGLLMKEGRLKRENAGGRAYHRAQVR